MRSSTLYLCALSAFLALSLLSFTVSVEAASPLSRFRNSFLSTGRSRRFDTKATGDSPTVDADGATVPEGTTVTIPGTDTTIDIPAIDINTPDTPDTPENPPDIPETPDTPEIPETPATPTNPDIPTTPDTPTIPNPPETPNVPGEVPGVIDNNTDNNTGAEVANTATVINGAAGDCPDNVAAPQTCFYGSGVNFQQTCDPKCYWGGLCKDGRCITQNNDCNQNCATGYDCQYGYCVKNELVTAFLNDIRPNLYTDNALVQPANPTNQPVFVDPASPDGNTNVDQNAGVGGQPNTDGNDPPPVVINSATSIASAPFMLVAGIALAFMGMRL
jgi:hypothetical protein